MVIRYKQDNNKIDNPYEYTGSLEAFLPGYKSAYDYVSHRIILDVDKNIDDLHIRQVLKNLESKDYKSAKKFIDEIEKKDWEKQIKIVVYNGPLERWHLMNNGDIHIKNTADESRNYIVENTHINHDEYTDHLRMMLELVDDECAKTIDDYNDLYLAKNNREESILPDQITIFWITAVIAGAAFITGYWVAS